MSDDVRRIRHSDNACHDRFFDFVTSIFKVGRTFFDWGERRGWAAGYEVFAIVVDDRIVSTVGRQAMRYVINGQARNGYQIGAVATHREHRNRGLARRLMERVLVELDAPDQPVILFANPSVLEFYPRFGFRRLAQTRFVAHVDVRPAGTLAPSLDLARATDRVWLANHCARAHPIGGGFTARDYCATLLFHLTREPRRAFRLDSFGVVVVTQQDGDRLLIQDLLATRPFSLTDALPRLCAAPARMIEFGFHPELWWPNTKTLALDDGESPLFVRGAATGVAEPVRFPELAHTQADKPEDPFSPARGVIIQSDRRKKMKLWVIWQLNLIQIVGVTPFTGFVYA
jgi:predicted N-acetyltransferase YhbS